MTSPSPRSPKVEAWSQSRFAPIQDPTQFNLSPMQSPSHSRSGTSQEKEKEKDKLDDNDLIPEIESISICTSTPNPNPNNPSIEGESLPSEPKSEPESDGISLQDLRSLYSRPTLGPGTIIETPPSKRSHRSNFNSIGTPQTPIPSSFSSSSLANHSNSNTVSSPDSPVQSQNQNQNQNHKLKTPPSIQNQRFGYGGHNRIASGSNSNPNLSTYLSGNASNSNSPLNPASTSTSNNRARSRTQSNSTHPLPSHPQSSDSPTSHSRRSYLHSAQMQPNFPPVRILPLHEKRRILVTGGAGFVGSHLVDRLLLMGHDVIVIDNFFTGTKTSLSAWLGHPNFDLVRHDVVNAILLEVDQVYHLACPASPIHYQANQIKTIKTNFLGTLNLLGLAKRTKARFLLASTSEVYGDPTVNPQPESYNGNVNPTGPRACYDEGKRVAETLTYGYLYQDDVDVRVARIFNSYGPRMHPSDGRVVSNFVVQALKGESLTIYGDGSQTRSFMFIHDLIDGLISLMNREPRYDAESGQYENVDVHSPVNLGNPTEFTIRELVDVVQQVVEEVRKEEEESSGESGVGIAQQEQELEQEQERELEREQKDGLNGFQFPDKIKIDYLPMPIDDPRQRRPDTTRAKELLGWEPRWNLKDGLKEMVKYYRMRIEEGSL